MNLTSKQAFELSKLLSELSVATENYRFIKWDELTKSEREKLESAEWSLLNSSSEVRTTAVGLVLDESQLSYEQLKEATVSAKETLKTLAGVRKVINIVTATISIAGAITSQDFESVVKNTKNLYETIAKDD